MFVVSGPLGMTPRGSNTLIITAIKHKRKQFLAKAVHNLNTFFLPFEHILLLNLDMDAQGL